MEEAHERGVDAGVVHTARERAQRCRRRARDLTDARVERRVRAPGDVARHELVVAVQTRPVRVEPDLVERRQHDRTAGPELVLVGGREATAGEGRAGGVRSRPIDLAGAQIESDDEGSGDLREVIDEPVERVDDEGRRG